MPHYHASSLPQSFTVLANSILISFIVNMVNQNEICDDNILDMNQMFLTHCTDMIFIYTYEINVNIGFLLM